MKKIFQKTVVTVLAVCMLNACAKEPAGGGSSDAYQSREEVQTTQAQTASVKETMEIQSGGVPGTGEGQIGGAQSTEERQSTAVSAAESRSEEETLVSSIEADVSSAASEVSSGELVLQPGLLTDILKDAHENYFRATAGCSLKAIRYAGQILDCYQEEPGFTEQLQKDTEAFYQTLSDDEQHELDWQLDDIFYAALGYDTKDMKEYCSQAGYEPKRESYPADYIKQVFEAVFKGLSRELPE